MDAAAAVGSTAVHLSAVLAAAHQNVAGSEHHPLPPHLEVTTKARGVRSAPQTKQHAWPGRP